MEKEGAKVKETIKYICEKVDHEKMDNPIDEHTKKALYESKEECDKVIGKNPEQEQGISRIQY